MQNHKDRGGCWTERNGADDQVGPGLWAVDWTFLQEQREDSRAIHWVRDGAWVMWLKDSWIMGQDRGHRGVHNCCVGKM